MGCWGVRVWCIGWGPTEVVLPNKAYRILQRDFFSIDRLVTDYGFEHKDTIIEYVNFLLEKEYCFPLKLEEVQRFPKLNLDWDLPHQITNAIIEIDDLKPNLIRRVIGELSDLGSKFIEIRCYKTHNAFFLEEILVAFESSVITNIDLYVKFDSNVFNVDVCLNLVNKFYRLNNVFLHSATETRIQKTQSCTKLFISDDNLVDNKHCGKISPFYFSINLSTFTESQKHNTCLNRKISIDVNGEIKNCPSMTKSYGNIKDTTLKEAIEKPGFKDMWFIHKDQIDVCKDCEFRHICTDCRAFIQDPNNIYSKPAKCSYDPYTATWGEDNPTNNPLHGK